jgi:hypothetical protein
LIGLTAAVSHANADTLYGITNDDNLISVNTGNPGAATLIGALDVSSSAPGLFSNAGNLYAYDTNNNLLRQINPLTAATISTINLGLAASPSEGDIAFHNGVGFLISNLQPDGTFSGLGTLYQFTLSPASATVVASDLPFMDGLAFSPTGVLYGLSQGGTSLYTIDPITGATTLIGTGTGIDNNCGGFACYSFGGLSFGSSGGLFADLTNFSNTSSNFYTIDPTTGLGSLSGAIPFDQVTGLTSLTPLGTPTPEPSTFSLAAAACLLALGAWKRRNA